MLKPRPYKHKFVEPQTFPQCVWVDCVFQQLWVGCTVYTYVCMYVFMYVCVCVCWICIQYMCACLCEVVESECECECRTSSRHLSMINEWVLLKLWLRNEPSLRSWKAYQYLTRRLNSFAYLMPGSKLNHNCVIVDVSPSFSLPHYFGSCPLSPTPHWRPITAIILTHTHTQTCVRHTRPSWYPDGGRQTVSVIWGSEWHMVLMIPPGSSAALVGPLLVTDSCTFTFTSTLCFFHTLTHTHTERVAARRDSAVMLFTIVSPRWHCLCLIPMSTSRSSDCSCACQWCSERDQTLGKK